MLEKDSHGMVAEGPFLSSTNRPSTWGPQRAMKEDYHQVHQDP